MEVDMRISNCTISLIVEETCTAIYQALSRPYLQLPRTPMSGVPLLPTSTASTRFRFACAIDGKHVLIKKRESGSLYFNYKKSFSFVLMPIVDADYRVLYADFGSQGHNNDAGIFNTSGNERIYVK
uniref:DDE Tnp4 domain-containing protein n=1 Tax=Ditylenchus dipsaci TaxID=166011 RepID=A0A915EQQ8_9BILA